MTRLDLWKEPMDKEIANMDMHQVWTLVDPPPNIKPMQNHWTFANRYDISGKLVGRKVRLVAKCFTQIPGVDYFKTYASVIRYESLRMNLMIAAAKNMEAWQVDYVGVYLNANNQALTYMEELEGYKTNPGKVCRITKVLYGTMDGATNWFQALNEEMGELGYYQSKADPSVRSHHADGEVTITSTYTDDVMGISSTTAGAEVAREELGWKYKVKDLGEASLVLGICIDRNRDARTITISQCAYLKRVLTCYGMTECNPRSTPLPLGIELTKSQAPSTDLEYQFMKDKPYHKVLGSVMYAQIATYPDLSYAVSTLSKFSSDPGKPHWMALMHVLQYIKAHIIVTLTHIPWTSP
jgi:hypothetical protein